LGTKELESAGLDVLQVAEAAVVPVSDAIKGRVPDMYISLKPGYEPSDEIKAAVTLAIEVSIGKIARPQHVYIVPDMPKTRSGKIMRRILRKIAEDDFGALGDTSTLADPAVVDDLIENRQNRKG
jgi:acetyl-CoA synthetase